MWCARWICVKLGASDFRHSVTAATHLATDASASNASHLASRSMSLVISEMQSQIRSVIQDSPWSYTRTRGSSVSAHVLLDAATPSPVIASATFSATCLDPRFSALIENDNPSLHCAIRMPGSVLKRPPFLVGRGGACPDLVGSSDIKCLASSGL